MPFIADTRCGVWKIELNVAEICGEMERMLEKEYSEDIKEGSKFWLYVIQIENDLNGCDTMPNFWEWFVDNYNNVEMWNEIQDLFVEEDSKEDLNKEKEEMMEIDWVANNSKFIDFSQNAMNRANEPDTEPESDTDYDTDDLPSDEEEIELKIIGYRPQTRLGECAGCKSICEECENLIITEADEFE